MDKLIIVILCINLIGVLIFAISCIRKGQKMGIALLFLTLPVLGFALYFIPVIVMKISNKFSYDRDSLVKRYNIEGIQTAPNVSKELDLIPVEDAMAVGSKQEKRKLLLEQLKKDLYQNYRSILPASSDADSEAAHYVAAAKMQVHQQMHGEILQLQKVLCKQDFESSAWKNYMSKLMQYINSELLEKKEAKIYKEEYRKYFEQLFQMAEDQISVEECTNYLCYTIDLCRYYEAERFWSKCPEELKEENGYRKMLEMYYNQKNKLKFYECISELEKSSIRLSAEGLMMLRFWIRRR